MGPLAVFPATYVLILIRANTSGLDSVSFQSFFEGALAALFATMFFSFWGILVAYLATGTFGSLVCCVLWRFDTLTLRSILLAASIPAALILLFKSDIMLALLVGYYSIVVAFAAWFSGLRYVKAHKK